VLWLERVETALAKNSRAGRAGGGTGESALMKDATPAEQAALKWSTTQAAANAASPAMKVDANDIAARLRDPAQADGAGAPARRPAREASRSAA
jgi:hypothetical protein